MSKEIISIIRIDENKNIVKIASKNLHVEEFKRVISFYKVKLQFKDSYFIIVENLYDYTDILSDMKIKG